MLSFKDAQTLIILRNVIAESEKLDQQEKRAADIKQVDAKPFLLNLQSAEAYITRALYQSNKPLHFGDLMDKIEALGWKSDSRYHKYNYIGRVLHDNYYMFKRVAPATYTLRRGFSNSLSNRDAQPSKKRSEVPIPSSQEIMTAFIKHYKPTSPKELYEMLKFVGYDFSLASVKEVVGKELARVVK